MQSLLRNKGRFEDLRKIAGHSGEYTIYHCPYCFSLIGREDKEGKFWFNTRKNVGICYRCDTYIVSNSVRNLSAILEEEKQKSKKEIYREQKLSYKSWTVGLKDSINAMNYLEKRKLRLDVCEYFGLRYAPGNLNAILFRNKMLDEENTDFFQIRYIKNAKIKYFMPKQIIKPASWLCYADRHDIVITEGFFSGLSAFQHTLGKVYPVVLTGKSLSDLQNYQIAAHTLKHNTAKIYVCLDGGFHREAMSILTSLHRRVSEGCKIYFIDLPKNTDPNDVDEKVFNQYFESAKVFHPQLKSTLIQ